MKKRKTGTTLWEPSHVISQAASTAANGLAVRLGKVSPDNYVALYDLLYDGLSESAPEEIRQAGPERIAAYKRAIIRRGLEGIAAARRLFWRLEDEGAFRIE